jgi:hypothetical protein
LSEVTVQFPTTPLPRSTARAAVTNGGILPGIDGRSTWARRLRDLVALLALGGHKRLRRGGLRGALQRYVRSWPEPT